MNIISTRANGIILTKDDDFTAQMYVETTNGHQNHYIQRKATYAEIAEFYGTDRPQV
jgi:hypothetical protein